MIRTGIVALLLLAASTTRAQERLDWYNLSPETGVFGAGIDDAYRLLATKKVKKHPIVALITDGVKITHPSLAPVIWQNPKEKPDGKDNDKDGRVDDCHGWNFLGGSDGKTMTRLTTEGEREFLRLQDLYADYITDGARYYKYTGDERREVPPPANPDEYNYYRRRVMPESSLARSRGGVILARELREYARRFNDELKAKYPEKKYFTYDDFLTLAQPGAPRDSLRDIALTVMQYYFHIRKETEWTGALAYYGGQDYITSARQSFERELRQSGDDRQTIVGDNPLDITDTRYGNPNVQTPSPRGGTFMAGLIAGRRQNPATQQETTPAGNNPIAEQARIMPLVVTPGSGEPYLKDIALAIRYAVDHQASIIILPLQNTLYPPLQTPWISQARRHAENKG
ncbi:MAG: S8 family serine peptidase, partial [Odoribacteraceae bacterium]|nr:S8 family serine peptidase [Odoribacteraceae bacterium]